MRIRSIAVMGLVLAGLASCGGGGDDEQPSYVLNWGPFQVAAGQEAARCVTLDLGNDRPIKVRQIRNVLGPAAVKLIVYKVDSGSINANPTSCTPFIDTTDPAAGTPLVLAMQRDQTLTLPEGVAFSLDAHQKIRLQVQYQNLTAGAVNVTASTELSTMDADRFQHEAGFVVVGNPDLLIPSVGMVRMGPKAITYPLGFAGARIFAVTGFTHRLGTFVEVALAASPSGTPTTVYEPVPFNWAAPPTSLLAPGPVLTAGGQFRLTCDYDNQTGNTVTFGDELSEEICYFGAWYYPKQPETVIF